MTTAEVKPAIGIVVDMGGGATATVAHCHDSEYITFADGSWITRADWRAFALPVLKITA